MSGSNKIQTKLGAAAGQNLVLLLVKTWCWCWSKSGAAAAGTGAVIFPIFSNRWQQVRSRWVGDEKKKESKKQTKCSRKEIGKR